MSDYEVIIMGSIEGPFSVAQVRAIDKEDWITAADVAAFAPVLRRVEQSQRKASVVHETSAAPSPRTSSARTSAGALAAGLLQIVGWLALAGCVAFPFTSGLGSAAVPTAAVGGVGALMLIAFGAAMIAIIGKRRD